MERTKIDTLEIDRIVTGLWQLAGGHETGSVDECVKVMGQLIDEGFQTFDMADHYGSAEEVVGKYLEASLEDGQPSAASKAVFFTKWCPKPELSTEQDVKVALDLARKRMKLQSLPLLQFHIWDYEKPSYLALLAYLRAVQELSQRPLLNLGLTNTNTAHLLLLIDSGFKIVSNQVAVSVLDRRILKEEGMADVCQKHGVGILAYSVLLGGFLNEKWLGKPEPTGNTLSNWSLKKYKRFIDAAGGWAPFQVVLTALDSIAKRHSVPISAVAIRYVLDLPAVASVIIGSRLSANSLAHAKENLKAFSLDLSDDDRDLISEAQKGLKDIPFDCGDEYRRAPFLTASGDLSDHIEESEDQERAKLVAEAIASGRRVEVSSGSPWEPIAGYCRAVRMGSTIRVSGTTATSPVPSMLPIAGGDSARSQTTHIFDIASLALKKLGGSLRDVVRTRVMITDMEWCDETTREHGRQFAKEGIRPANTLCTAGLVGSFKVEIEFDAELGAQGEVLRI